MSFRNSSGFTLIEILVASLILLLVALGGATLLTLYKKEEITGKIEAWAAETAEAFFSQRRKGFQTSFETPTEKVNFDLGLNPELAAVGEPPVHKLASGGKCETDRFPAIPPIPPDNRTTAPTYRQVSIPSSGCSGPVRETISNECRDTPITPKNPAFGEGRLNFSGLTPCERALIKACAHPDCGGDLSTYYRMIVRVSKRLNGAVVNMDLPIANEQGVIGAALCMIPNGSVEKVRTDPLAYTGINFNLLLLVKDAHNRVKLVRRQTSFPRPQERTANSIIVNSIGCDRNQH